MVSTIRLGKSPDIRARMKNACKRQASTANRVNVVR
jgi:hypothetical protein